MNPSRPAARPAAPAAATASPVASDLEATVSVVEQAIATLGETLGERDIAAVEAASTALHETLRAAMAQLAQVVRAGTLPAGLRQRFALANARAAAQREALFRATSLVEQNLEILIPRPVAQASVYGAGGAAQRGPGRVIAAS